MGTAVLHPQDCLVAPQNDQNRRFRCASECPSSVAKHGGRVFSASFEAWIPAAEFGRDVILGNTVHNGSRGRLGRKNSSSGGLLPLPDQVSQNAHHTYRRLAPKISACMSGKSVDSYFKKQVTSSHHSNFSLNASEVGISRCSPVPMLDHAARARRFLSDCFPSNGVQFHDGIPQRHDTKSFPNSAHGNCMAIASSCFGETSASSQKPKILANTDFPDMFNPVRLRWAVNSDWSSHYRKSVHPELSQVEVYLGRQCAKPPYKVLPNGQDKSLCKHTDVVGRKFGVNKQLKRSASEILQKGSESPFLRRPAPEKAPKRLTRNFSQGKIEKSPQMQVSLNVETQGRMCVGAARSSQVNFSQQRRCARRNVGASLRRQCCTATSASVERKDVNEEDRVTDNPEFLYQDQDDVSKVDVTSTDLDTDEMWMSMMSDERWAGPSFFNSPPPSSLPVPSFALLFSRTLSTSSEPTETADSNNARMVPDDPFPKEKCTWDAAFATKDLRRMLHLDSASCDF